MPIANTARYVMQGTLLTGEVFAWGFWEDRTGATGPGSQSDWDTVVTAVKTQWATTAAAQACALIRPGDHYTQITGYYYGTGGSAPATYISTVSLGNAAGTGTKDHPDQTCQVVTLLTGLNNARGRGRCYLPATGANITNGLFADVATVNTAIAAWWSAVFSGTGGVVVYSKTDAAVRKVVNLRSDTRPDIQRRRANKQTGITTSIHAVT